MNISMCGFNSFFSCQEPWCIALGFFELERSGTRGLIPDYV